MKKVLIIASHPDDDILGCGGFISRFNNEFEIKVIFIAEGTTCRFSCPTEDGANEEIEKRNSYGVEALKFLGVNNYKFYNLPCGRLDQIPLIEINKIIEAEINYFSPNIVFTHCKCDSNKDHHKVYDSTIIATRPGSGVEKVLSYEVLSSTEWGFKKSFTPNVFISLTEQDVNNKCIALNKYKSEIRPYPYPRSTKGIFSLSQFRGIQSGNEFAEAFELIRETI